MARSEHLPIYKASYDLCLYLEQIVRHFSRYHPRMMSEWWREGDCFLDRAAWHF
jgi:hypothetical protein